MAKESSWKTIEKLIVNTLGDHASRIDTLHGDVKAVGDLIAKVRAEDLPKVREDIAALKVKAGLWGALAGLVTAVGGVLLSHLK